MKKLVAFLLVALLAFGATSALAAGEKIGVAMPTQSLQRWNQDGDNMKKLLEDAGYTVDLQYANNEVATQVSQLENMILGGCKVLVIASIDGKSLGTVLAQAKEAGVQVIAYDRLIRDTDAVSYYATFDNYKVGKFQGDYIVQKLDLENAAGPFNIELFAGSPDDNNATYFFKGAWDALKPYKRGRTFDELGRERVEHDRLLVELGPVELLERVLADHVVDDLLARPVPIRGERVIVVISIRVRSDRANPRQFQMIFEAVEPKKPLQGADRHRSDLRKATGIFDQRQDVIGFRP
jgi:hypothetical protein